MMDSIKACWWYIFDKDLLLLQKTESGYKIPYGRIPAFVTKNIFCQELTVTLEERPCIAVSCSQIINLPENYEWVGLRAAYDYVEKQSHVVAGKAFEMLHWDKNSQYCSSCGNKTVQQTPISKFCAHCNQEFFPNISPAVLVLVRKDNAILLVRAHNFKGTFYGLVAGFLETGESLEECVRREVMEETGLQIKNITYFGSQPWPYPSGLMVGYMADYESGELKLQAEELSAGAFYEKDALPELPRKVSLARKMIDWWIEE